MKHTITTPAGCRLLGFIENSRGDQFIMADTQAGAQRFATWQRNPEDGGCFWGHYFKDERAALADLIERASGAKAAP